MQKYIIGVDEAGRGPLAGPVAVGVVCVSTGFDWKLIKGVNDSKKLSEKKREAIFLRAKQLQKKGLLEYKVSMVNASVIDAKGIVWAIKTAMKRALFKTEAPSPRQGLGLGKKVLLCPSSCCILLDGSLYAPEMYINQKTIIKGDQKEKVIGLASIMAKVTRDRYMVRIAATPQFAPYAFRTHKGYGTKAHCEAIRKHGLSEMHRATFCKRLL